jgi:hypothetical protein
MLLRPHIKYQNFIRVSDQRGEYNIGVRQRKEAWSARTWRNGFLFGHLSFDTGEGNMVGHGSTWRKASIDLTYAPHWTTTWMSSLLAPRQCRRRLKGRDAGMPAEKARRFGSPWASAQQPSPRMWKAWETWLIGMFLSLMLLRAIWFVCFTRVGEATSISFVVLRERKNYRAFSSIFSLFGILYSVFYITNHVLVLCRVGNYIFALHGVRQQ